MPFGVARMQNEALRRMRQLGLHNVPPEAHHLRLIVDEGACASENLPRGGAADFEPRLLQNPKRCQQNAFDLLGA
jgi:hypothetical protein